MSVSYSCAPAALLLRRYPRLDALAPRRRNLTAHDDARGGAVCRARCAAQLKAERSCNPAIRSFNACFPLEGASNDQRGVNTVSRKINRFMQSEIYGS